MVVNRLMQRERINVLHQDVVGFIDVTETVPMHTQKEVRAGNMVMVLTRERVMGVK